MFSRDYVGKWKNHYVLGKDLHLAKTVRDEVCNMSMIKKFLPPCCFSGKLHGVISYFKKSSTVPAPTLWVPFTVFFSVPKSMLPGHSEG